MATGPQPRGYGISKTDMEASRLIFVSLKNAQPRRKVAVPIPEGATWQQFEAQVIAKLRIAAVGQCFLASSGQQVLSLDMLQDIDEVVVEERIPQSTPEIQPAVASNGQPLRSMSQRDRMSSTSGGINGVHRSPSTADDGSEGEDSKYTKRSSSIRRFMQRWFPQLNPPSLPMVWQDVDDGRQAGTHPGGQRRHAQRRPRRARDMRNLLMLFFIILCMGVMTMLYLRLTSGPSVGRAADQRNLQAAELYSHSVGAE